MTDPRVRPVAIAATAMLVTSLLSVGQVRYDQRQEGTLRVGHRAPDVSLVALDGKTRVPLAASIGEKPLVLVFGSYT